MPYVDGFLIPMPKKNLRAYKAMASKACKIWMEYGALAYYECVGDDLASAWGVPFPKAAGAKSSETVCFSWIIYKNKKQRDAVNKKIMTDARIQAMCNNKKQPFDMKRMCYGGFEVLVSAVR